MRTSYYRLLNASNIHYRLQGLHARQNYPQSHAFLSVSQPQVGFESRSMQAVVLTLSLQASFTEKPNP